MILSPHDIHLWRLNFGDAHSSLSILKDFCSDDEIKQAGRFFRKELGAQALITRGLLRLLLAHYLGLSPSRISISQGTYGKPRLENSAEISIIEFNLSHADQTALFAFSLQKAVGVDIERIKPRPNLSALAAYALAGKLEAQIKTLSQDRQLQAFYKFWTRQEALAKAVGCGIGALPEDVLDAIGGGSPVSCLLKGKSWTMCDLQIEGGYATAVCREGGSFSVFRRELGMKVIDNLTKALN